MAKAKKKQPAADNRKKVIALLNEARAAEVTAIMQYMTHHYELEDRDYGKLAKVMKDIAIQEMKHAEALAERVLFLGGEIVSMPDGKILKGQSIEQMLATDKALESGAMEMYNDHARRCVELGDHVSKDVFEKLLAEEEDHWDEFDTIEDHVQNLGASYLATQTGGDAD